MQSCIVFSQALECKWLNKRVPLLQVCRAAGYFQHALFVSQAAAETQWYLDILLEDMQSWDDALAYLQDLPRQQAAAALKKHGKVCSVACVSRPILPPPPPAPTCPDPLLFNRQQLPSRSIKVVNSNKGLLCLVCHWPHSGAPHTHPHPPLPPLI